MLEVEYKERSIALDYFVEIGSEIIKIFRESNMKNDSILMNKSIWDNDKQYDKLYQIAKEKQSKFKEKFFQIKDKKLFDFSEQRLLKSSFYVNVH